MYNKMMLRCSVILLLYSCLIDIVYGFFTYLYSYNCIIVNFVIKFHLHFSFIQSMIYLQYSVSLDFTDKTLERQEVTIQFLILLLDSISIYL